MITELYCSISKQLADARTLVAQNPLPDGQYLQHVNNAIGDLQRDIEDLMARVGALENAKIG